MYKNKIVIKLFTVTAGVLLAFLAIQFLFQYVWMEKFYIYHKEKNIIESLENLEEKIEKNKSNKEKIDKDLYEFSQENNAFAGIANKYGIFQYGLEINKLSYINVKGKDNEFYKIFIDDLLSYNESLRDLLQKGKDIKVQGQLDAKEKTIYPKSIIIDDQKFLLPMEQVSFILETAENVELGSEKVPSTPISIKDGTDSLKIEEGIEIFLEEGIAIEDGKDFIQIEAASVLEKIDLNGVIDDLNLLDKKRYGMDYQKEQLRKEFYTYLDEQKNIENVLKAKEIIKYIKIDTFTGRKNMVFIEPLIFENKEPMILFVVSSLEPIKETTTIMKSYFIWILLIAMILAIVAAYFYSKKITKPLLHMNDVTKDMAKLDFSHTCKVETEDELGALAQNINILSEKLKKNLAELQGANEKLKKDIDLKGKMEQMRKNLIADISHELKTPLTVMKGICEGMSDGIYDVKNPEYLKRVLEEINNMGDLVYDLLEISKIESGEVPLNKSIFQLSDVILKVHRQFKTLIKEKNLQVTLELNEDFVLADESQIEKVIRNLYANAVNYTPKDGKIIITMKTSQVCNFSIENTPAHIPNTDLERILEPFYRVEKSRNKALGGSGLGLYIVKNILERHNSDYDIENTKTGVKVSFSLPIVKENID